MLFSVCVISAHAGRPASDDSIASAEKLKNECHEAADSLDMEINQEYLANSYEANMTYYGQKELDAINQQIASLSESVKSDKAVSAEARSLMQTLPRTSYNEKDNTTAIIFNVSEEVEEAVLKSEKITNHSDTKKVSVKLSDSELQALNQFHDLIASFKENVNCSDDISYTVCTDYEQGEDQTEGWRPGRSMIPVLRQE